MVLSVWHSMVYRYASEVARSTQYIRLRPCVSSQQKVLDWSIDLPGVSVGMIDAFDNLTEVLTLDKPHQAIRLLAHGRVEVSEEARGEPAGRVNPRVFLRATPLTCPDGALAAWAAGLGLAGRPDARAALIDLMAAARERVVSLPAGAVPTAETAATAWSLGRGSVRDQVHVFMAAARALGWPARYVSGYACTADRVHLAVHSWAEVWVDDRWHRFDLTQSETGARLYLSLATGLDELDACPVRGMRLGGGEVVVVSTARGGEPQAMPLASASIRA